MLGMRKHTREEPSERVSSQQKPGRGKEKPLAGQECLGFTAISVSVMLIMWETLWSAWV